jgi:uncharacterized membrane protein YbaN (DUF454 family)
VNIDKNLGNSAEHRAGRFEVSRWNRPVLFTAGWTFLAVGVVGLFLPFLPGTLFLILAATCFARSSPRFEAWLLDHPRLGPPVRAWRAKGAIPRRAKVIACASLVVSWLIILVTSDSTLVKAACLAIFVAVAAYLVSRPDT